MNTSLLTSLLTIGTFLMLIAAGTYAFFHDSESSVDNTVCTGAIDLEVNDDNPISGPAIAVDDMIANRWYYENITLHMTGESNPAKLWMRLFNITDYGGNCSDCPANVSVEHTYGDDETTGSTIIYRSNGDAITYDYEANKTRVKFEGASSQLGEDDTVGLTDTFIVRFLGGMTPVTGEIKAGTGTDSFTLTQEGDSVPLDANNNGVAEYEIRLVDICCGSTFTFEVESIVKEKGLSYVQFEFTEDTSDDDSSPAINISQFIDVSLKLINQSSGNEYVIISEDEGQKLSRLNNTWINLTDIIPYLEPCTDYTLQVGTYLQSYKSIYFNLTGGNITVQKNTTVNISVLGAAITYGAGGDDVPVKVDAEINNTYYHLFNGQDVNDHSPPGHYNESFNVSKDEDIVIIGKSYDQNWWGHWYELFNISSDSGSDNVIALQNGDTPPYFEPFGNQPNISYFLDPVMDPDTGLVSIGSEDILLLFELGTPDTNSPAFDMQDLVVLVTAEGPVFESIGGFNGEHTTFDIEFYAEQTDGPGIGG